jgi:hypothetical protein
MREKPLENILKRPDKPGERRWAKRYDVSLQMQIWPELEERGRAAKVVETRDVSMCGIYFACEAERDIGTRFNFSIMFVRKASGEQCDLMSGVARIVRCEPLASREAPEFGVAMAIEKTTYLREG